MFVGTGKINRNLEKTFEIDPITGETVTPIKLGQDFQGNGFSIEGINDLEIDGMSNIPIFEGEEFLAHWYSLLAIPANSVVLLAGDSTVSGQSVTTPFIPNNLLDTIIGRNLSAPAIQVLNYGVGATKTSQWATTAAGPTYSVETQIVQSPDLWIIRYGLNDASPESTPIEERLALFEGYLKDGIDKIRVQQGDNTVTSILIMSPNSAQAQPENESWLGPWTKLTSEACRKIAREKQCGFFDTYHLLPDSNGLWQDTLTPIQNGYRHLHPNDAGNSMIYSALVSAIIPQSFFGNGMSRNSQVPYDFVVASAQGQLAQYTRIRRSRGTLSAPAATQVNDSFDYLDYQGYDGSDWVTGFRVSVSQDAATITGHTQARLEFSVDNGVTLTPRVTIKNTGLTITQGNLIMSNGSNVSSSGTFAILSAGEIVINPGTGNQIAVYGDVRFIGSNKGPVIPSPNGTYWRITVDNAGALSAVAV